MFASEPGSQDVLRNLAAAIAGAILAAPAAAWWSTGLAEEQSFVEWNDAQAVRLDLGPARDKLAKWKAAALADEAAAGERPSQAAPRSGPWWRVTGLDSAWFIPDWQAVAEDFDVVHLSVTGYLRIAGRALAAGSVHTVLAGWNPDESFWLTDVLETDSAPTDWRRADQRTRWEPAGMAG